MTERLAEFEAKSRRIRRLMESRGWDWLALATLASFAWAAGGARSYVSTGIPTGVAMLLFSHRRTILLTDAIEHRRLLEEELAGLPVEVEVLDWPSWFRSQSQALRRFVGSGSVAADVPLEGAALAAADLRDLRLAMTPWELDRLRPLAREAALALEQAARAARPGDTEHRIAARIQLELGNHGILSPVILVAADERVFKYRHPLPTPAKLQKYAMLVACAAKHGLHVSATRFVHFGPVPPAIRDKAQSCAEVDAAFIAATTPGAAVKEVFAAGLRAYAAQGYPEEWKLHHQGGAAGYASREFFADESCAFTVLENQPYAWNPSITGVKSEDTILTTAEGPELLTSTGDWPSLRTSLGIPRPAILQL